MDTKGVYVGRFAPMHIGHESVIHTMLEQHGRKNCVVVVGSCNASLSYRDMFSYSERTRFIRRVFPTLHVIGLADFPNDDGAWLQALDEMLNFAGWNPNTAVYYGGSEDDLQNSIFDAAGRSTYIVDRTLAPHVSATNIRELLARRKYDEATALLDPRIHRDVVRSASCALANLERIENYSL